MKPLTDSPVIPILQLRQRENSPLETMNIDRIAHDHGSEDWSIEIDLTLNEGDRLVFYRVYDPNNDYPSFEVAEWPEDGFYVIKNGGSRWETEATDVETAANKYLRRIMQDA